jgi:hypothetical protein
MKDYPIAVVASVHDGKLDLSPTQRKIIASAISKREGQDVRLTISQRVKQRSNNQNRYMWSVVYEALAAETGHTTEEIHEFMKSMYLPRSFIQLGKTTQQLTKSTTTLSTYDMEVFLEQVRAFAASELGVVIPLPNES